MISASSNDLIEEWGKKWKILFICATNETILTDDFYFILGMFTGVKLFYSIIGKKIGNQPNWEMWSCSKHALFANLFFVI